MNWNFSGGETWAQVAAAFAPAVGQPQQIPIISNVDYNVHGQIIRIDYANGNVTTYVYDPQNQRLLNLLTQNAASQALQNFTYTYDSVGNILRILDQAHTATQNFQYDELNRLLAAQGQVYGTKTFQYNEIGNITLKDGLTYRYGENGAGPHAVTSLLSGTYVTETFRYDFNGNMMQRNQGAMVTDYLYDVENRLKQVKKRGVVIGEYEYDGDGGRVKRTDFRSVNTGWYSCFLAGTKVLTIEYANPNDANVESDAEGAQALRSSTRKHLSEEGLPETFNNDSNQPSAGTLSNSRRELAALGARPHSVASSDNPARLSSQRPASGGLESLGLLPYKLVPKNIEDIKIGDAVLSYDETKMQNVVSKVTEAMEEEASEYLVINDFLKVTAEHPFYVARAEVSHAATSRGMSSNDEGLPLQYVPAGELKVGDKLLTSEQQEVAVQKIEKVSLEKPIQVYNLSVAPRENNFPGAASRTSPEIAGGALTDLSHNYYVMSQSHNVTKSQDVTCDPVTLCPGDFVLVHNKLSFYAAYPGGRALVTKYVGSLYEEDNNTGRRSNFIFLGGTRVAAVTTVGTVSKILWYHDDHLGGTNVITDSLGAKKEVIEYSPFGEFSRRDRYGSSEETAWYYFTGKPYDDETGLIYFGARYYDPSLARFITPDMVVQDPTDPQTLNRYSYVSNNPINRVDPDGRSWKKFFKAIFDTFKFIHNPVQSNPFVNGIVTGNWSYARDMAIAGATGFVFGGPIGAATAMATTAVMRTPIAQWTTENLAHYYYDNVLGMSPRTAYITSYLVVSTGVSLGAEKMFASFSGAKPAQLRKEPLTNEELKNLQINGQYAGDENVFGPSLKTKGAFEKSDVKGLVQDGKLVGSFQKRTLDVPGLKQLGAQHSSVNALNASGVSVNPFSYATWGVCNQAANATLLNAGISSTVLNLGPSWDMFVTTAVYGNYGGQLGNRVLSGVNANQNYEE
ncbi:MAG: hypothetical protein A3D10_04125 [Omnitrophica WOR_2 bacterium RIFCSPHIGHO2_02_FULL_48_11]|nr:MAG: hypothetical protein A3D10_04125 [Omnitrophica WOR_2 bacterium RIFCSPHIGHO2_02_FULL_48_11]